MSELTPERIREMLADADALAEENKTSEFASESGEEILARHCHELAAALSARDRQLAELRARLPDENGRGDVHQQAQAWCLVYNEMLDWGLEKFMDDLRDSGNGECGAMGAVKFIRRLAALLPPTAKEEARAT